MSRSKRENVGTSPALGYAENLQTVPVKAKTSEQEVVDIVHNSEDVNEIKIENESEGDLD